jgi:hypothetical protein
MNRRRFLFLALVPMVPFVPAIPAKASHVYIGIDGAGYYPLIVRDGAMYRARSAEELRAIAPMRLIVAEEDTRHIETLTWPMDEVAKTKRKP